MSACLQWPPLPASISCPGAHSAKPSRRRMGRRCQEHRADTPTHRGQSDPRYCRRRGRRERALLRLTPRKRTMLVFQIALVAVNVLLVSAFLYVVFAAIRRPDGVAGGAR